MSVINTNVMSLNAQRNLTANSADLGTTIQRLSSGLRINSAKDDAAGLAISERFTTQIRGMDQAARNANDGISLAQTAEGALGEIGNNLQRIRELAVQSRNATNSSDDRAALQKEVDQLKSEISRVAETTNFNGTSLLDGSFTSQAFQVGADQGQTISIDAIANANIDALGTWTSVSQPATAAGAAPAGAGASAGTPATPATLALGAMTDSVGGDGTSTLTATFTAGGGDTLSVEVTGTVDAASLSAAFATAGFAADGTGEVNGFSLDLGGEATIAAAIGADSLSVTRADGDDFTQAEVEGGAAYTTSGGFNAAPAASVDGETAVASTPATFSALSGTAFTINGTNIEVGTAADAATRASDLAAAINAADVGVTASVKDGALSLSSADDIEIGGTDGAAVLAQTGLTTGTEAAVAGTETTGFADLNISTAEGADNAMLAMDAALKAVNDARADLGAVQNRFSSVVTNLQTGSENLSAARSRIMDADYAKETANLSRTQILQQAGTAMLAQANQSSQSVLSLLR